MRRSPRGRRSVRDLTEVRGSSLPVCGTSVSRMQEVQTTVYTHENRSFRKSLQKSFSLVTCFLITGGCGKGG
eukprot:763382-Prymnesium_polylepis.1